MENKSSSLSFIMLVTLGAVGLIVINSMFLKKPQIPDAAVQGNNNAVEAELKEDETAEEKAALPKRAERPRSFRQLGSFDPEGKPLVVTIDSRGGTIRRIEMNERKPNGNFKYYDVDYRNAWIGHLELERTSEGPVVRLVGIGTPAHKAGVQVDDIIKEIDGEPITNQADFDRVLADIKPEKEIQVKVQRSSETKALAITTKLMPMQIIRASDPERLLPNHLNRRAFQFTLKEQQPGAWPDTDEGMRTANWDVEIDGDKAILKYDLYADQDHPLEVIKTFALSGDPERPYHLDMDIEVRNLGKSPIVANYELCGPTGTTKEGWWYQMKTHGGTWAIGKLAGARDITMATEYQNYHFISGPQIIHERTTATKDGTTYGGTPLLIKGASPEERTLRKLTVDSLYFNVGLLPKRPDYRVYSGFALTAETVDEQVKAKWSFSKKSRKRGYSSDISYVLYSEPINLAPFDEANPESAYRESFEVFAGPKDPYLLDKYNLGDTRTFGWFAMFSKPLIWMLHLFYAMTGSWSYGIAIVLLTVLVRSLLIPFSRKAALNAQMMQYLAPQMKELQEKYKEDPRKFMQARSELCAKYNYRPLSGCLVMFIQIPVFLGLYRGLSVDVALRDAPLIPGLGWCSNLGGPDQLFSWESWMPGFLGSETGFLGPYFNLLPVLAIGLMVVQQKLFMPPATDDQSRMAQNMMKYMMLFMGFIFFKVPAGLCIYFITSSLWAIIERKMLPKPELNVEKFEDGGESSGDNGNGKKFSMPFVTKAETMTSQQKLDERKRRDRERKKKLKKRS